MGVEKHGGVLEFRSFLCVGNKVTRSQLENYSGSMGPTSV